MSQITWCQCDDYPGLLPGNVKSAKEVLLDVQTSIRGGIYTQPIQYTELPIVIDTQVSSTAGLPIAKRCDLRLMSTARKTPPPRLFVLLPGFLSVLKTTYRESKNSLSFTSESNQVSVTAITEYYSASAEQKNSLSLVFRPLTFW